MQMRKRQDVILLLCSEISNKLKYASGLILEDLLGLKVELTTNLSDYENFEGAKMQYATNPSFSSGIFVCSSGFLEKTGLELYEPEVAFKSGLPQLLPCASVKCNLGFDVFAATFYLVSRYEEYLPGRKDQHGRFKAEESFAFRHGFLEVPLVNHYAQLLKETLQHYYPALAYREPGFTFVPTYDIDVAYAYRGRGLIRWLGATLRSIYRLEFEAVAERFMVLAGNKPDPFDTYDLQLGWQKKFAWAEAYYFFLCGKPGLHDHNISCNAPAFQNLVKTIAQNARVGIHPSYASAGNPKQFSHETACLSAIAGKPILYSRQHYLRVTLPETYRLLIQNNIQADFSMGYASHPGFRASIATPFPFYDLPGDKPTGLTIYPFAVMDGTLKDYMNLTPTQAISKIESLIQEVRKVNGTFISLWHNDALSERGRWKGWRPVYEALLELVFKKSLSTA